MTDPATAQPPVPENDEHDGRHRFLFEDIAARGALVQLQDSWQAVLDRHEYPEPVARLLGETLVAAALLSSTIKIDGHLLIQARGDGPIQLLVADCSSDDHSSNGSVRGMASFDADWFAGHAEEASRANLKTLLGEGVLAIMLEPHQGERYQGIVPLDADTLAGCLEHYFMQSEQLATRLWLGTAHGRASGLMLQELPGEVAGQLQSSADDWLRLCLMADTLKPDELALLPPQTLLYRLFSEDSLTLFEPEKLEFYCACSRERMADALLTLPDSEIDSLLQEMPVIGISCQFCHAHYDFDNIDIEQLRQCRHLPETEPQTRH